MTHASKLIAPAWLTYGLACGLALGLPVAAVAQTAAPAATPAISAPEPATAGSQKIERIRIEDKNTRIDELRVGGETQQITVQPKGGSLPAYEVKPSSSAKGNPPPASSGDTNGSRVWNFLKF